MNIASLTYGGFPFSPLPQVGYRDVQNRLGASRLGAAMIERIVTIRGVVIGNNLAEVRAKYQAVQDALAKSGQILYFHDGYTVRINAVVQPMSLSEPEEWSQYEAGYQASFSYFPLGEQQYNPFGSAVTYVTPGPATYTFTVLPVVGFDIKANRDNEWSTRYSSTVKLTLQGFLEAADYTALSVARVALLAAFAQDGTLNFGPFVQACRVLSVNCPADVMVNKLAYTITLVYDQDLTSGGIIKLTCSRRTENVNRIARHYIPFLDGDDSMIQVIGRGFQTISLTGSVLCTTNANALAAVVAILADPIFGFPAGTGSIDEMRDISENMHEPGKVDFNCRRLFPVPALTGGAFGGLPIY